MRLDELNDAADDWEMRERDRAARHPFRCPEGCHGDGAGGHDPRCPCCDSDNDEERSQ